MSAEILTLPRKEGFVDPREDLFWAIDERIRYLEDSRAGNDPLQGFQRCRVIEFPPSLHKVESVRKESISGCRLLSTATD